ncbi:hypothetical protein [Halorubrum sp. F4]|uniref:hypothetical protein n=1 Tax=Halorubrum sp. F4 TaxID=2989715 RepID=UPI002480755E|nr:hypothetical protein [Halorubrum sp. F4]
MTFSLPDAEADSETIRKSREAIEAFERDRKERERRRLELSRELNDPTLGPGMWP